MFLSVSKTGDYHKDMNNNYAKWIKGKLIPLCDIVLLCVSQQCVNYLAEHKLTKLEQ